MQHHIVSYAIVLALGLAGYLQAPAWAVPAGAACLTLDSWGLWRLRPRSRPSWSSKAVTYLVTGVVLDLALAALAYGAGQIVRMLLG